MRFHVINLPHTQTTKDYVACAYTQKAIKFSNMMSSLGHEVILYASEENEANCDELVTIASKDDQERWFGTPDYHTNFFNITWSPNDSHWVETNNNAIREISKRIQPRDFICLIAGVCQKQIADSFPAHMSVEYGIGYRGVFSDYKVFESYSLMHWVYGSKNDDNGRFYDCVIPNYFDPDDFEFREEKDDYYVWMGRFIIRKGPGIATEVTRRLGSPLIMAGQGVVENTTRDGVTTLRGDELTVSGEHIEHIGHVSPEERSKLLAGAKATFMATTYLEPFGGVAVESLMSGTPVIATDFGAFPENIPHGVAGYRFRTIGEATQFASDEMLDKLDPNVIRKYAVDNFSMDVLKYRYQDYFDQLETLWEDGFYSDKRTSDERYTRWI